MQLTPSNAVPVPLVVQLSVALHVHMSELNTCWLLIYKSMRLSRWRAVATYVARAVAHDGPRCLAGISKAGGKERSNGTSNAPGCARAGCAHTKSSALSSGSGGVASRRQCAAKPT